MRPKGIIISRERPAAAALGGKRRIKRSQRSEELELRQAEEVTRDKKMD